MKVFRRLLLLAISAAAGLALAAWIIESTDCSAARQPAVVLIAAHSRFEMGNPVAANSARIILSQNPDSNSKNGDPEISSESLAALAEVQHRHVPQSGIVTTEATGSLPISHTSQIGDPAFQSKPSVELVVRVNESPAQVSLPMSGEEGKPPLPLPGLSAPSESQSRLPHPPASCWIPLVPENANGAQGLEVANRMFDGATSSDPKKLASPPTGFFGPLGTNR